MENAVQVNSPTWTVLGIRRQTPFTYLARVMGRKFDREGGEGGGGALRECVLLVSCKFHTKTV